MADRRAPGVPVVLHEMRPVRMTEAHKTDGLAELVCSNSLPLRRRRDQRGRPAARGDAPRRLADHGGGRRPQAAGRRRARRRPRSFLGRRSRGALAEHPLITIARGEIAGLPPADWDSVIIATGPLTSPALAAAIQQLTGETELAFFDAIAPIVHLESIDAAITWRQSRYDKAGPGGTGADYINCPMTQGRVRGLPRRAARRPRRPRSRSGRPPRPTSTAACPSR